MTQPKEAAPKGAKAEAKAAEPAPAKDTGFEIADNTNAEEAPAPAAKETERLDEATGLTIVSYE
jgi:hypothetical protein